MLKKIFISVLFYRLYYFDIKACLFINVKIIFKMLHRSPALSFQEHLLFLIAGAHQVPSHHKFFVPVVLSDWSTHDYSLPAFKSAQFLLSQ